MNLKIPVLFAVCLTFFGCFVAEAKRPKKKEIRDASTVAAMAMPDLQSVLGSAYDSPMELSDRAIPGAVIEVLEFGYRPIINDCVAEEPFESAFTNITMQSSLSGGVSFGIGGQGAAANAGRSLVLKFISPYILGYEMVKFFPSDDCLSTLQNYGGLNGSSNLFVVQEALFARINGCNEISSAAGFKVNAVGGEANVSASCQLFSNQPVAVGVRLVSVEEFLSSRGTLNTQISAAQIEATPVEQAPQPPVPKETSNVVEARLEGLSGDLAIRMAQLEEQRLVLKRAEQARVEELERQRLERERLELDLELARIEALRPYQEKATADWMEVKVFAAQGDEFGREALKLFISEYANLRITVGNQSYPAEIPEIAEAEIMLRSIKDHPERVFVEHHGFETVVVSGGHFIMGCMWGDDNCRSDEFPRHKVSISHDMEVMTTEVTQLIYQSVMGQNPSSFSSCGLNCPVEQVTWYDAIRFANALSHKEGYEKCYGQFSRLEGLEKVEGVTVSWSCDGWRLPSEAEWEYLARGGEEHLFSGSNDIDAVAWYGQNTDKSTKPVAQKQKNGFGLYDMSGNVWEWTWSQMEDYTRYSKIDPRKSTHLINSEFSPVFRGGSWFNKTEVGVEVRYVGNAKRAGNYLGFRLVRGLPD